MEQAEGVLFLAGGRLIPLPTLSRTCYQHVTGWQATGGMRRDSVDAVLTGCADPQLMSTSVLQATTTVVGMRIGGLGPR